MASLKEIVERHLHYEVAMLFATYNKLVDGGNDGKIKNALVESFCIHARVINDFLGSQGRGIHAPRLSSLFLCLLPCWLPTEVTGFGPEAISI